MPSFVHLIDQRRLIAPGGSTVSGDIYFYYAGTSILAPVFQDVGMTVPSPNPTSVGAGEIVPMLYLDTSILYRRVIEYSDGTVDEQDPIGSLFSEGEIGLPVGSIIDYAGPVAPHGFLLCYGQEVNRVEYSELFAAIGVTYGAGNGSTTFNLPDSRGRVSAGKDNMGGIAAGRLSSELSGSILGSVGGEEAHVLTLAELAAHNHSGSTGTAGGHTHNMPMVGDVAGGGSQNVVHQSGSFPGISTASAGDHSHTVTINNAGSDQAHNNIQPTIVYNKIIKATETTFLSLIELFPSFDQKANATALGVAPDDTDMGAFTGTTIPSGSSAKEALQSLETGLESAISGFGSKSNASAIGISDSANNMGTSPGTILSDNGTAKQWFQESEAAIEAKADAAATAAALAARPVTTAYASQSSGRVSLGYGSDGSAGVNIGANDAFRGRGALVVGGAGPKDRGNGTYLVNDGHPNWVSPQSSIKFGPTEFNIYGNATGGIATSTGTTTLTKTEGSDWDSSMVGRTIWFRGVNYTVNAFVSATQLTLNSAPPAGTGAWNFPLTTGGGTCTVTGTTITRVSGEPFVPVFGGTGFTFRLNGTARTVTFVDTDTYTAAVAPGNGTYTYDYYMDINAQISTLRLQKVAGSSEENIAFFARPDGYWLSPGATGSGELYPFWMTSNYERVLELHATGKYVSLGGIAGKEAARFPFLSGAVNYAEHWGGTAGNRVNMRARGADTNVGWNFDVKGSGDFIFTSGQFGRTNFKIYGSAGTDYLATDAVTGAPYLAAEGASANIDIAISPKGSGVVRFGTWTSNADAAVNGYITIKDAAGNTRKLATIA